MRSYFMLSRWLWLLSSEVLLATNAGTTPSGTSAYFSIDIGMIHITALSTKSPTGTELAWLTKDLEAANKNRKAVRRIQAPP